MKMKKILLLFICLFINIAYVKADEVIINLDFEMKSTFYAEVTKSVSGNVTTFTYLNRLPTMDLTDSQLKTILKQKSGVGSGPLTYYEDLKITVTPDTHSDYAPLVGKSTYYRVNTGGKWVKNATDVIDEGSSAEVHNLVSYYWPYGFAVSYRKTTSESYTTSIPSGTNLAGKSLEEKLAILIGIDLDSKPNGVVDAYNTLWYFRVLPNSYTLKERFDVYSAKSDSEPILVTGKTDQYEKSSLNHIDTGYVVFKYDRTATDTSAFLEITESQNKTSNVITLLVGGFLLIGISLFVYYINKDKIIKRFKSR